MHRALAVAVVVSALAGCGGSGPSDEPAAPSPAARPSKDAPITAASSDRLLAPPQALESGAGDGRPRALRRTPPPRPRGGAGVSAGAGCADAELLPAADTLGEVATATLCLLNAQRAAAGLQGLTRQGQLDAAAEGMSLRMVRERFFAHVTPDGRTVVDRVRATGYIPASGRWVLGENLAWGSGTLASPLETVEAWMRSPGHRANVLAADYREIGIGVVLGAPAADRSGGATFTTVFGARPGAAGQGGGAALTLAVPARLAVRARSARSISYRVRCSRACRLSARLRIDPRTARTAGLRRSLRTLGRATASLAGRGTRTVVLRLTPTARSALRRARGRALTLVTEVRGTGVVRRSRVLVR